LPAEERRPPLYKIFLVHHLLVEFEKGQDLVLGIFSSVAYLFVFPPQKVPDFSSVLRTLFRLREFLLEPLDPGGIMQFIVYLDPVGHGQFRISPEVYPNFSANRFAIGILFGKVTGHVKVVSAGLAHQNGVRYLRIARNLMKPQDTAAS